MIINHGREAGASLAHPHAQILGLPFVPGEILDEERAFARFAGGCVICTTIEAELAAGERVVFADDDVVCIAPFWSGAPFELLLMPRRHELHLQDADARQPRGDGPRRSATPSRHLNAALGDVAYNLGFHTAPHEHAGEYHWHVHLWPNLVTPAGFERGTGVMINVMPPETGRRDAARRPHPGVTRIRVSADYDAPPGRASGTCHRADRDATSTGWPTPRSIRFVDRPDPWRRHAVRVRHARSARSASTDRMEITEWEPGGRWACATTALVTGTGRFTLDAARRRPAHAGSRGTRS